MRNIIAILCVVLSFLLGFAQGKWLLGLVILVPAFFFISDNFKP
jgi:hypothetical protein